LLRGAIEEVPVGVATTRDSAILYANTALARMFGGAPGELDGKKLATFFGVDTLRYLVSVLDRDRVYHGRVRVRALDGREFHAEVHIERYTSESGTGGFLVMRDVTIEQSALARLVTQLGGAMFHYRVDEERFEQLAPGLTGLLGLSSDMVSERPRALIDLIEPSERVRLGELLARMIAGTLVTTSTEVTVRLGGTGAPRSIQITATAQRDLDGEVRRIDGVITSPDRAGPVSARSSAPPVRPSAPRRESTSAALAVIDISRELLREGSMQLHTAVREARAARSALTAAPMPDWLLQEVGGRIDRMVSATDASVAINRRVRRGLEGRGKPASLREVLSTVIATLSPAVGETSIGLEIDDVGTSVVEDRLDELTLLLSYLALRVYRLSGAGTLSMHATAKGSLIGEGSAAQARLTFVGTAPPDGPADLELSTDVSVLSRQNDFDRAYIGAQALLGVLGGVIESDESTLDEARCVICLRLGK
jgi:PAS domain S-box-containing protein